MQRRGVDLTCGTDIVGRTLVTQGCGWGSNSIQQ